MRKWAIGGGKAGEKLEMWDPGIAQRREEVRRAMGASSAILKWTKVGNSIAQRTGTEKDKKKQGADMD